jgi:non-specific protein-tyrosine kinase
LDVQTFAGILRARYKLIIAVVALALLGAFVSTMASAKAYDSQAKLIVGQSLTSVNPDVNQITVSESLSATYSQIATTRPILQAVIDKLGLKVDPSSLQRRINVSTGTESTLITIQVRDADAKVAADIANEIAAQLIAYSPTIQGGQGSDVEDFVAQDLVVLQDEIRSTQAEVNRLSALPEPTAEEQDQLLQLQSRLLSLRATYASMLTYATNSASNHLTIIESAVPPASPSSPQILVNILLALVAGLLIAIAIALVLDHVEDHIKTREDAERVTGLSVLGLIPRMATERDRNPMYSLAALLYPRSPVSEAFRALRTNIDFTAISAPARTIVVTSPQPLDGKTTVACNLALVYAQAGRRTILVDADLRVPAVHRFFSLSSPRGLTDLMLSDDMDIDTVAQTTEQEGLRIITAGSPPPNPAELLGSARMRTIVERLAAAADIVIFDCSPINLVTDPAVLSKFVDGSIVVVDAAHTRRDAARAAGDALSIVGTRVLGLVMNRMPNPNAEASYGYYGDVESGSGPMPVPVPSADLAPAAGAAAPAPGRKRSPRR